MDDKLYKKVLKAHIVFLLYFFAVELILLYKSLASGLIITGVQSITCIILYLMTYNSLSKKKYVITNLNLFVLYLILLVNSYISVIGWLNSLFKLDIKMLVFIELAWICIGFILSTRYFIRKLHIYKTNSRKQDNTKYFQISGFVVVTLYFLIPKYMRAEVVHIINGLACLGLGLLFQHHCILYIFKYKLMKKYC